MIKAVKTRFRHLMLRHAQTRKLYLWAFTLYHRCLALTYFARDIRRTFRFMRWDGPQRKAYWPISSELLFQYHKLEKGLCMTGPRRFFGADPAKETLELMSRWQELGFPLQDPIYQGAVETLRAYRHRLDETPPPDGEETLCQRLDAALSPHPQPNLALQTPMPAAQSMDAALWPALERLAGLRRSVRCFKPVPVEEAVLRQAIAIAQHSPSACNRQSTRIHWYTGRERIDALLALQNGNRGFGHTIHTLLLVTAELGCFFDASERNQPQLDAGLFLMSFLLALQAQGVASCCLNWCVEPGNDKAAHRLGKVPDSESIITYLAVGYAEDNVVVPRSPRRDGGLLLVKH